MDKHRTENFESPLDQVFDDLPQENPPTDLQQRCLGALDEIDAEQGRSAVLRWYAPLRNVVATAAVLVLAVGLFTLLPLFMSAKKVASTTTALSAERQLGVPAQPPPAPQPGQPVPEARAGPGMARGMPGPAPMPPVPEATVRREAISGTVHGPQALEEAEAEGEQVAGLAVFGDRIAMQRGKPPESGTLRYYAERPVPAEGRPPQAPEVEEPWRDLSGERQVVVDKELDLEVKDVEKSYDEARSIVEKHGGFVASDEISTDAHALDTAVLTIRLPKDGFGAAIAELRELGRVIKLIGESQDVTREYFGRGAEIRSRADREQMLVEKYEKETNPRKKRQLKDEIEQLRREMRREKEILTKLAEETHWPTLQLTLKERGGPAGFLSEMLERSGRALAWVGATAIIWVPLVVLLTLFWGRRRRTN